MRKRSFRCQHLLCLERSQMALYLGLAFAPDVC